MLDSIIVNTENSPGYAQHNVRNVVDIDHL